MTRGVCIALIKSIPSQNRYFPVLTTKRIKLCVFVDFALKLRYPEYFQNNHIPLYFSKARLYVYNLCATLMPVETGVWDNKERCIGSLWGDQHYELEYNCGRGVTAIYAPFQRRGRWGRVFEESIFCPRGGEVGWVVSWV